MSDQVGLGADEVGDAEPLLAFTNQEETVIDEALVLDNFTDAANIGCAGKSVRVDNPETEIGLKESVHHYAVAKLKDLQRKDSAGKEDKGKREKREFD